MSVLLADGQYTAHVRTHPFARDAHGQAIAPANPFENRGPYPGASNELQDASWGLRLDPRVWPLEPGDEVSNGVRRWVVGTAKLNTVPGVPDVDYVAVTATLEPPEVP